jgi:hypothetical protein
LKLGYSCDWRKSAEKMIFDGNVLYLDEDFKEEVDLATPQFYPSRAAKETRES